MVIVWRRGFTVIAAITLLLVAPSAVAQSQPPGIRMVELDGRAVRLQTMGLENRRPGAPVVVFESGATASLEAWRSILPEVSTLVPAVAYDRAGLGHSEWDGMAPTPRHATDRLRRLLRHIGADPPYILVGHSWGGMLMRYYAGYHPEEVAGLVLADPAPMLTLERRANLAPFDAVGAGQTGYDAYWEAFSGLMSRAPPAVRAEFAMLRTLLDMELTERDLQPLPSVPLVVIVAGRFQPLPIYDQFSFDGRAYFEADLRHRIEALQEWALASPDGLLLVASRSTHSVPREAPDLIVWSIRRVLDAVCNACRQGRAVRASATDVSGRSPSTLPPRYEDSTA